MQPPYLTPHLPLRRKEDGVNPWARVSNPMDTSLILDQHHRLHRIHKCNDFKDNHTEEAGIIRKISPTFNRNFHFPERLHRNRPNRNPGNRKTTSCKQHGNSRSREYQARTNFDKSPNCLDRQTQKETS